MSRDMKSREQTTPRSKARGGTLLGMFFGLVLGVAQLFGQRLDYGGSLYAHLLFLVTLMVRPKGLAGGRA